MAVAQSIAYPMHGGMIGRQEQNGPSGSGFGEETDPSYTLTAGGQVRHGVAVAQPITQFGSIAGSLTARHDSSPCVDRGQNVVAQPMAVVGTDCYNGAITGDVAATIGTPGSSVNASGPTVMQPIASDQTAGTLRANPGSGWRSNGTPVEGVAIQSMQVRRLTPTECERLQGFPDGYTNIPWRKATESPDGPRYKALGNSMAVPVMAWIGKRIKQVSEL